VNRHRKALDKRPRPKDLLSRGGRGLLRLGARERGYGARSRKRGKGRIRSSDRSRYRGIQWKKKHSVGLFEGSGLLRPVFLSQGQILPLRPISALADGISVPMGRVVGLGRDGGDVSGPGAFSHSKTRLVISVSRSRSGAESIRLGGEARSALSFRNELLLAIWGRHARDKSEPHGPSSRHYINNSYIHSWLSRFGTATTGAGHLKRRPGQRRAAANSKDLL